MAATSSGGGNPPQGALGDTSVTGGEESRAEQPSALLPKKRIKPATKPPVFKQRSLAPKKSATVNSQIHSKRQEKSRAGGGSNIFGKYSKDLAGLDLNQSLLVDSSMISGLNRSFQQLDDNTNKKTTGRGAPPVTIETTSTFDFHESVSRPFAGIS